MPDGRGLADGWREGRAYEAHIGSYQRARGVKYSTGITVGSTATTLDAVG